MPEPAIDEKTCAAAVCAAKNCVWETGIKEVCGTEGRAGTITEMKLRLVKCPEYRWGLLSFHSTYGTMQKFYKELSGYAKITKVEVGAADWFSKSCCRLLQKEEKWTQNLKWVTSVPKEAGYILWTELWGEEEEKLYTILEHALEILEAENDFAEQTLAAANETEFSRIDIFRHTITEAANFYQSAESVLLDWYAEENARPIAETITELLQDAEYAFLGHMARGMMTLCVFDDAGKRTEQIQRIHI